MSPTRALVPGLLLFLALPAQSDVFTLSTGLDYSQGSYGTPATSETWYVPVIAKYETGPMIYKLTVPYLRITNPAVGPDGVPVSVISRRALVARVGTMSDSVRSRR